MRILMFLIFLKSVAFAQITVMASHGHSFKVSKQELAALYLGKTDKLKGIQVTPIDNTDRQSYEEFYRKVVDKTPKQLHAYWMQEMYRGNKVPPQKLSSTKIKEVLSSKQNIVAYAYNHLNGEIILTVE